MSFLGRVLEGVDTDEGTPALSAKPDWRAARPPEWRRFRSIAVFSLFSCLSYPYLSLPFQTSPSVGHPFCTPIRYKIFQRPVPTCQLSIPTLNLPTTTLSMSSAFFTAADGDVILRAGREPGSRHDFRVHKLVLSAVSPVFEDMFTSPQPPNQNFAEQFTLPIFDIPHFPEVLDTLLRYIYAGVEAPTITDLSTLTTLFSIVDEYNISSMWPTLRKSLKTFLSGDPFAVYIVACRYGFLEEAKEAAMVSTPRSYTNRDYEKEARHASEMDIFRFIRFVYTREGMGQSIIRDFYRWSPVGRYSEWGNDNVQHWDDGRRFYTLLAAVVEERFTHNPCLEIEDLLPLPHGIPDVHRGCEHGSGAAGRYSVFATGGDRHLCPLGLPRVVDCLTGLVRELHALNRELLASFFGNGVGSE